jgi:hypothetical protein
MAWLSKVFELNRDGFNWPRAVMFLGAALVPLIVLWAIGKDQYMLSAVFGVLFLGVIDPGGAYGYRASHMAAFALAGAALTALGFAVGTAGWGWVTLAAFVITLLAGLAVRFGVHRFVAALLLNIWFIVAFALAASYKDTHTTSHTWAQVLAWMGGCVVWIAVTFVAWLVRGREDRPQPVAELPGDTAPRKLTPALIVFAGIRALALAIAVAIAFGLHLPNADWMPLAALAAMKPSLEQTTLVAEQRVMGALVGAVLASVLLLTVHSKHALEVITVILFGLAGAIRFVNYTLYCAAVAGGVLIAIDIPHPSNLGAEGERVLFTFIGVGIGVVVMLLANVLGKRRTKAPPQPASQPA